MVRFLASLTLAVAALAVGSASFTSAPDHQSPSLEIPVVAGIGPSSPDELTTIGEMLVTAEWFDQIFRGGPNNNEPGSRLGLEAPPREAGDRPKRASGTYRTLCVRSATDSIFPSVTPLPATASRAMPSSASTGALPVPDSSCTATPVRTWTTWSTLRAASIVVFPPRSCTGRNTSRTAPAADYLGIKKRSPDIAFTLKPRSKRSQLRTPIGRPSRPSAQLSWLQGLNADTRTRGDPSQYAGPSQYPAAVTPPCRRAVTPPCRRYDFDRTPANSSRLTVAPAG